MHNNHNGLTTYSYGQPTDIKLLCAKHTENCLNVVRFLYRLSLKNIERIHVQSDSVVYTSCKFNLKLRSVHITIPKNPGICFLVGIFAFI